MKSYIADTNFYLRFLLQDNIKQAKKAELYLKKAKKGDIRIIFLPAVILEMNFVLKTVVSVPRVEIANQLTNLIKTTYVEIENRDTWLETLQLYKNYNIDLLDIFLFFKAKKENAEVLSFDRDFVKLKRKLKD